jgi:hypothetical protein
MKRGVKGIMITRTYVIDGIATIPTNGQQLSLSEGECVPKNALKDGHRQSCTQKADPMVIKERERLDSKAQDVTCREAEGQKTCGEC